MTKKMKVIMENWDRFILQEEFEACDTPFKVGDMLIGVDLVKYLDDEALYQDRQEIINRSEYRQYLKKGIQIGKAIKPFASLVLALDGGATAATLGAADAAGGFLGQMFALGSKNEGDNRYTEFLSTFCVDNETLDLIEDKFQQQYVTQTDIVDKLQDYFKNANPESPLPDITEHLVEWLNTKSAYAGSEETKMVTK
tara:strand:- start:11589 stop:12179 length:591 start_codon:yes stop_codon:yes gene_type:complete